jgi:predicted Zn-dependent protease
VLGRLHAEAPKIPLVTGWISRDKAVSELRRALELAPDDLLTNLFLAEALLEFRPEKREEALDLLQAIASSEPSAEWRVEDAQTIEDARALLAELHR